MLLRDLILVIKVMFRRKNKYLNFNVFKYVEIVKRQFRADSKLTYSSYF